MPITTVSEYECARVVFKSEMTLSLLDNLVYTNVAEDYNLLYKLFEQIQKHSDDGDDASQIAAKAYLLMLIAQLAQTTKAKGGSFSQLNRSGLANYAMTEHVKQIIGLCYGEDITLEWLASKCAVSKEHLCRQFKKYVKISPMEYLVRYRIQQAKRLLMNTDYPISTISQLCGFKNSTYFYKAFKRRENVTPSEYRKYRI